MGKDYINNTADVAVWMICHNQAAFIAEAIESVMAQKTNFSFKLVIADDCSTDNTQEICENYVLKFPDKILYYRNKSNLGFSLNGQLNYERCYKISNKYIALLEGDDYWIDNEKLQKQYDLLEEPENQKFVICATNYVEFYEDKQVFSNNWAFFQGVHGREMPKGSVFEIKHSDDWKTKTATVFFRKSALKVRKVLRYRLMVDSILIYELTKYGQKLFLNECTAAYRLQCQGNWSMKTDAEKMAITQKINDEIRRVNFFQVVLVNRLKKVLYRHKKRFQNIFFGLKYRRRGLLNISSCNYIEPVGIKHNQIFLGYKINFTRQFYPLFQSETNYEMKPFLKVTLNNGRIITDSSTNLAIFNNENYLVEEISFAYIRRTTGEFIHGSGYQNYFFKFRQIQRPRYIEGKVFALLTGGGKNFNIYHWFFDSLSRLYAIKNELDKIDYFLVPEYVQDYQIESLRILGINKDKVISSLENKHVIAKELICTSHPRTATFSVRKEITNFLRDRFILPNYNDISKGKFYPARFYISRQDAPRRKVDNESEVILKLKKKGIAEIKISNYSFMEVVYLFSNASFILSTHSAALTNILFCKQGTTVVEYFPNLGFLPYYSELSDSLNLDYHLIMDSNPLRNDIKSRYDIQNEESIMINMNLLLKELNEINENRIS